MSSPLVTLHNATCGYGARDILTDVDLEIRAGEAVALLGSNGAGKSTLLKAITGLAALRGSHRHARRSFPDYHIPLLIDTKYYIQGIELVSR